MEVANDEFRHMMLPSRMTGCLKAGEKSALLIRPPICMIPCLSMNGSRRYNKLVRLIAFLHSLATFLLVASFTFNVERTLISSSKASACRFLMI